MAEENHGDVTFVPEEEANKQASQAVIEAEVVELEEGIVKDLKELKNLTGDSGAWFWRGIMQGAGAIIGSIAMVIFLGWVLGLLGVIPGFGELAQHAQGYLDKVRR